jgi:hypothetical protein
LPPLSPWAPWESSPEQPSCSSPLPGAPDGCYCPLGPQPDRAAANECKSLSLVTQLAMEATRRARSGSTGLLQKPDHLEPHCDYGCFATVASDTSDETSGPLMEAGAQSCRTAGRGQPGGRSCWQANPALRYPEGVKSGEMCPSAWQADVQWYSANHRLIGNRILCDGRAKR